MNMLFNLPGAIERHYRVVQLQHYVIEGPATCAIRALGVYSVRRKREKEREREKRVIARKLRDMNSN